MELLLHFDYKIQGMDHSVCGSSQIAPDASYYFLRNLDEVSW